MSKTLDIKNSCIEITSAYVVQCAAALILLRRLPLQRHGLTVYHPMARLTHAVPCPLAPPLFGRGSRSYLSDSSDEASTLNRCAGVDSNEPRPGLSRAVQRSTAARARPPRSCSLTLAGSPPPRDPYRRWRGSSLETNAAEPRAQDAWAFRRFSSIHLISLNY
jgi:hypothetical protein